jgi:hypothetical protein
MPRAGSMPGPGALDIFVVKAGPGWLIDSCQSHPMQIPFMMMLSSEIVTMFFFRFACKPTLPVVDGSKTLGRGTALPDEAVYGAVIVEFGPPPIPVKPTGPAKSGVGSNKPAAIAITRRARVVMATSIVNLSAVKKMCSAIPFARWTSYASI